MGTPTVKTKFVAEGEKEYRAAIAEMNSGLKTLDSEMKLVTERFKGNEDSMEALSAKSDVLERKWLSQKEKVEELRKALAEAANTYGESDERTQKWQRSLNNAEAQMLSTERELQNVNEAMTEQNSTMTGLGELLDSVAGKFGIDLPDGLKSSLDGFAKLDTGFLTMVGSSAALVTALAGVEKALAGIAQEAAGRADDILTQSSITNLTTDTIQELEYAADLIDVSFDTISGALTKVTKQLGKAADGSDEAANKFYDLGVSIYDANGNLRSAEAVFYDIVDALGQIPNETERDAAAMDLLGKSAQDLNPLIKGGSEALAALRQEAHDVGYVMDSETLAVLGALDDSMVRFDKSTEQAKNTIGAEFAPMLKEFYDEATEATRTWGDAAADSGVVAFFGDLLDLVTALLPLLTALGDLVSTLGPIFDMFGVAVAAVADGLYIISNLAGALVNVLKLDWSGAGANLSNIWTNLTSDSYSGKAILRAASRYNASGTSDFPGGMTWVGENGPELVSLPRGSQILNAQESRSVGGDVFYITIPAKDIKEFQDIIKVAQNARREERQGRV